LAWRWSIGEPYKLEGVPASGLKKTALSAPSATNHPGRKRAIIEVLPGAKLVRRLPNHVYFLGNALDYLPRQVANGYYLLELGLALRATQCR
jgi:hypothetical protein